MNVDLKDVIKIFEEAVRWLQINYITFNFFHERDIEWTLQTHLIEEIKKRNIPLNVNFNYRMPNKDLVDIVLQELETNHIYLAVELKYEPDHKRVDIAPGKLIPSKVFWDSERNHGVIQDIKRIDEIIKNRYCDVGYVVFIDEGSHHSLNKAPDGCIWDNIGWGKSRYSDNKISVLVYKRRYKIECF